MNKSRRRAHRQAWHLEGLSGIKPWKLIVGWISRSSTLQKAWGSMNFKANFRICPFLITLCGIARLEFTAGFVSKCWLLLSSLRGSLGENDQQSLPGPSTYPPYTLNGDHIPTRRVLVLVPNSIWQQLELSLAELSQGLPPHGLLIVKQVFRAMP